VSADRSLGSALLFPHRHPQETPPAHVEIIDLIGCADEFVDIEAAREFGKTTLCEEWLCMGGCFGTFHYCLLVGETYQKACDRLAAITFEARTNIRLHQLFGGKVIEKSIENKLWFKSGTLIEALGWEQELQSFKHRDHRPDFCYMDDPENLERVRDGAAVDQSMKKLYLELLPALDKTRRRVRLVATRRAEDCMTTRLAANSDWLYRAYPVCRGDPDDPDAESLWPDRYPMEWIRKEKASYQGAGMLQEFMQAYLLIATDPAKKPFREEMLGAMDVSPWHWMPRYIIYDPSRTSREKRESKNKDRSDRTGKVVVSRMGSKIIVHESSGHYWQPNELIDDLFAANEAHRPAKIGIEANSLDDWLLQPIRFEMIRRGETLPLAPMHAPHDRSKNEFIMGLQPFAQAKDIVLVGGKLAHSQLVAEWTNFPQGPRDVINALAYSLRTFSGVPVYEDFSGANIAEAPTPRMGEVVHVGFSASASEAVAVAVVREGRRFAVSWDGSRSGALSDAVKALVFDLRIAFPKNPIEAWVPADVFDQWQRIGLVPALRAERIVPRRAEHISVARGCLSEPIRMVYRDRRALAVGPNCRHTLNALGAGYAYPVLAGGRSASEPEAGVSRLVGEALECMIAMLTKGIDSAELPKDANIGYTPSGKRYVTSNPRRLT
jgi:hypothetical protein